MKKEIYKNTQGIENRRIELMQKVKPINDLLEKIIDAGFKLSNENYKIVFTNPKEFVINQLTNGAGCSFGGVKMNTDKAFEILEIPQDIKSIVEELQTIDFRRDLNNFILVDNKLVESESFEDMLNETESIFVKDEIQNEVWERLNRVSNDLNFIAEKLGVNKDKNLLLDCFSFNSMEYNPNEEYKANPKLILKLQ